MEQDSNRGWAGTFPNYSSLRAAGLPIRARRGTRLFSRGRCPIIIPLCLGSHLSSDPTMFALSAVQTALQQLDIDGWLLYDFRGLNVLAQRVLEFPADAHLT